MLKRFLFPAVLLVSASAAHATILIDPQSGSPTSDGAGGFNWNYDVTLQPGAFITAGDQFAVYDVQGLKGASFTVDPALTTTDTFNVTTPATGPQPGFFNPTDTATPNVVVTLSGSENITQTVQSGPSLRLGTLTIDSTFGAGASAEYGSLTHKVAGLQGPLFSVSSVAAPVPEPGTFGFMGIGLATIAALGLRRTRRSRK
jgi:hypothetical protein